MTELRVIEVRIWGRQVGALAPRADKPGFYEFQYSPSFVKDGLELSPLGMPLHQTRRYSFPALALETFQGLPGLLADSLPDRFGLSLIDEHLVRQGTQRQDITPLHRLASVGNRAMGALEFEPGQKGLRAPASTAAPLELAHLVEDARRTLRGEVKKVTRTFIEVGSSAGGTRAKAVIGWNPVTGELVPGQLDVPPGFEHWLLKLDGVGDDGKLGHAHGFGRIEYAHHLMATAAGVQMSECRLLEENGRAHFMTKRFDRIGNRRLHVQSLCGLQHLDFNTPYLHGYEQYFRTILTLKLGADALKQAWTRCVFNVVAKNCDDHTKNLAFLMAEQGTWSLAPAYDVCFAHNPAPDKWTHQHQMLVAGKASGITQDDLLSLAQKYDINRPREALARVLAAVSQWPKFALAAGVYPADEQRIAKYHELL